MNRKYIDDLSFKVIGAAIEVHKNLGQGLLESIYHRCIEQELTLQNIKFRIEVMVPVVYKGVNLVADLSCDLLVEECLVVELKAVEKVLPIHEAQLLTYMKLLKAPKEVLINFNCFNIFKNGQQTYVNEFYKKLPEA